MKVLAIVPARCGSKGFPNKNIAKIGGKTLIELAINVAIQSNVIDDVYISTDCKEYETIGINSGAKSLGLRSEKLATDTAKSIDVIIDLIKNLEINYDYVVLLQVTSPIRTPIDILNMIELIKTNNADAAVSVSKLEEPHPYKLKAIDNNGYIKSFIEGTTSEVPRQSLPEVYALNGALYITKVKVILENKTFLPLKTMPYIMKDNINIDTEEDYLFLKSMYNNGKVEVFT